MAAKWLKKYLTMKPEVSKIFEDLEQYREYCKFSFLKFDEKDLYKSDNYRKFDKQRNWHRRQQHNQ